MGNVAVEAMKRHYLQRLETWEGDEEEVARNVALEAMGGSILATDGEVGRPEQ